MRGRMPEPCLCGAPDCRRCFPGNFDRHGRYIEDDAAPVDDEFDAAIAPSWALGAGPVTESPADSPLGSARTQAPCDAAAGQPNNGSKS